MSRDKDMTSSPCNKGYYQRWARCLDVTSTHTSSTGDYDPNGMTSECNNPKTFRPRDTTSVVLYGPRFHVHPCFDLDVMSHVMLRPT